MYFGLKNIVVIFRGTSTAIGGEEDRKEQNGEASLGKLWEKRKHMKSPPLYILDYKEQLRR